jgi:hypothetical protein
MSGCGVLGEPAPRMLSQKQPPGVFTSAWHSAGAASEEPSGSD